MSLARVAPDVAWEELADGALMVCHLPTGAVLELSAPAGELWRALVAGQPLEGAEDFLDVLRERRLIV